jgi:hypothetical protein
MTAFGKIDRFVYKLRSGRAGGYRLLIINNFNMIKNINILNIYKVIKVSTEGQGSTRLLMGNFGPQALPESSSGGIDVPK